LGLFVQLSPAPPGELALFRAIGIGLEWWNNKAVERWVFPRPANCLKLGSFGMIGLRQQMLGRKFEVSSLK
jgi:hypothetical protein